MTLGCARCGDCCRWIGTSWHLEKLYRNVARWAAGPDPAIDPEGFAGWSAHMHISTEEALEHRTEAIANYEFVRVHWHLITQREDGSVWRCDAYDSDTALCTAHTDRPPICQDYPWYGQPPDERGVSGISKRCSYLLDIAPERRPEGSRPLIPITPIER